MRSFVVLFLVLGAACATSPFGADQRDVSTNVSALPDTILRIATTQLQQHGYEVVRISDLELITTPQRVPDHVRPASNAASEQQWVIRVSATPLRAISGSRIRVEAFLVPPEALQVTYTQVQQNLVPVTALAHPRLFEQVETVAGWVTDAVARRRR